jgi:hypothetical protein
MAQRGGAKYGPGPAQPNSSKRRGTRPGTRNVRSLTQKA